MSRNWLGLRKRCCANRLCRQSPCRRWFRAQGTVHQRDENRLLRLMESVIWDGFCHIRFEAVDACHETSLVINRQYQYTIDGIDV